MVSLGHTCQWGDCWGHLKEGSYKLGGDVELGDELRYGCTRDRTHTTVTVFVSWLGESL